MEKEVLELFKAMVIVEGQETVTPNTDKVQLGIVTDFTPSTQQNRILKEVFKPLAVNTMFTREERDNADPYDLITKQFLHYVEVYGLGMPGVFDLVTSNGTVFAMTYVRGVTLRELEKLVQELLYTNAPVKDTEVLKNIINHYGVTFDINRVANNELRVVLFDTKEHQFESGDDAVRYMVYQATGNAMLIKSKEVVEAVKAKPVAASFLEKHERVLAEVFNRHKRVIVASKKPSTKTAVNRISRLSKTKHVPLREAINKTFVAKALADKSFDMSVLNKISIRDKFKYLNLLAYKRKQNSVDAFIIRNGKMHIEPNRKVWDKTAINRVEDAVVTSLKADLAHLNGKKILLDQKVKYGLPTSRNQTVGQLPFGTRVSVGSKRISAGMYWENEWGASDLDLTTIDADGHRTGWGQYSGYNRNNPITYSGDVTDAYSGAMEFMTSKSESYGLFVNIFSGQTGCEMEVVVGADSDKSKWIGDIAIREKMKLNSRGNIIGFVHDNEFVVYSGRLGDSRVQSGGKNPMVERGLSNFWTVNDLFDLLEIDFEVDKDPKVSYNYELTYEGFSFDKLESLLLKE